MRLSCVPNVQQTTIAAAYLMFDFINTNTDTLPHPSPLPSLPSSLSAVIAQSEAHTQYIPSISASVAVFLLLLGYFALARVTDALHIAPTIARQAEGGGDRAISTIYGDVLFMNCIRSQ